MKGIMIQGTSSDVGKSYITTAVCRILSNRGKKVAPYKSQNLSNNSYVVDNGEIGRAQGVQAEAARQEANAYMNPILLKPHRDGCEVVLMGKVHRSCDGFEYRDDYALQKGLETIRSSLKYIEENYDYVVIEGAGSPAEVNLNDKEIVNMRVAEEADVDVILVVDVDRGGSFASIVGTLELVFEHRHRIKGIIFNKFRGDVKLFEDGISWIEEYTGIKVMGVIPYMNDIYIEVEDAQSDMLLHHFDSEKPLDIAVVHMERVSNNTDIEAFIHERDVSIRIVKNANEFGSPHAVIIPGTKSTISDLQYINDIGLSRKIQEYYKSGGIIFGICGGFQVLGKTIYDPAAVDNSQIDRIEGMDILPVETVFLEDKQVRKVNGKIINGFKDENVTGYEIHLGQTKYLDDADVFIELENGEPDGAVIDEGRVIGTYMHNIFHNDSFRNKWLNIIRKKYNFEERDIVDTKHIKEESFEKLAQIVEQSIDMEYLMDLIEKKY